jgi:uncharacterized membrane protein YgcG
VRKFLLRLAICIGSAIFTIPSFSESLTPIPQSYSLVNDQIQILTIQQRFELHEKLRELEDHNGVQIILLTVPTTGSEGIVNYSQRVMEAWDPGHNGESTAVLFAIDAKHGSAAFRTGGAITGALPDITLRSIWDTHLDPHWRKQEWSEGILESIDAIIAKVWDEQTDPPVWYQTTTLTQRGRMGVSLLGIALLYSLYYLAKAWRVRRRRNNP